VTTPPEVLSVLQDLHDLVNDSIATVTWARIGFGKVVGEMRDLTGVPENPENPDPMVYIGVGDPNLLDARALARWRRSEMLKQLSPTGDAHARLGRQWLVSLYQEWEDDIRPRLGKAFHVSKERVIAPVFGDLRLMRHDIIHKRGVASSENSGRTQILKWFSPGETIDLVDQHFLDFKQALEGDEIKVDRS
jgi:hypothetical protein